MRFWLPRALLALLAVLILLQVVVIAPRLGAIAVVGAAIWMALPGVFLARRALGPRDPSGIAGWLVGPGLGFGFSVFGVLLLWAVGLRNWFAIVLGPGLTWIVAALAWRFGGPTLRLPIFDRRDIMAVSLTLLVVPLITWAPYDHVREPVADGEAYRAYFTADFVWGMTVTAELAKGDVPPVNPFLRGAPLRYYWMSHLLSGVVYRNTRGWGITSEHVVLLDGLAFGLAAVAFLYALARIGGASPAFAALVVATAFVANSYEGVNRLWVLYRQGAPLDLVKTYNIDAVTRWFYQGMPVDGLQRMLLYQPHHLTGYMLALAALWLVALADDVTETSVALWAGILLGLGFLFSTFTAIIVGVAIGILFALRLVARRAFGALWQCAILGAGPVAVAVAVSTALGYTDPAGQSLMIFGLNPHAVLRWPLMLFLSFGPLLLVGIAGLARWRWVARDGAAAAVLVASALAFYFLVDVRDQEGVWVGWRAGHLVFIAFTTIGAAALSAAWRFHMLRVPLVAAMGLAIVPAVPTVAIDVYNAQDITNRQQGPNFPWTLIITPPEREALDWVRRATPPKSVVQYETYARGNRHWAYITAFAERRMAAGLAASMIPSRPFQMASDEVQMGVFQGRSAADAHAMAVFLGIDYLFVGDVERRAYRPALMQMRERPDLFPAVFQNDAVTIYGVTH